MDRKTFIKSAGIAGGVLPLIGLPALMNSCGDKKDPEDKQSGSSVTFGSPGVFDLHCHPGTFFYKGVADYPGDAAFLKTIGQLSTAKMKGTFVSLVTDMLVLERTPQGIRPRAKFEPGQAWEDFNRQLGVYKNLVNRSEAEPVSSLSQLREVNANGIPGIFLACEGGDFLEGLEERVELAYEEGVRSIQLVHYAPNELGDLQTYEAQHGGLSPQGREIVKKMNELGMLIDVAHASFETVKGITEATTKPVMLSHSILKMEAGRPIERRAISSDHAKLVAETGGTIGAWPSGFNKSFDEFVENTLRLADVVGIDHVSIGTDMDASFRPVITNYSQVPKWTQALAKKGLSENEVEKLASGNILRVLEQVL